MSNLFLKSGTAGLAIAASLALTTPAFAQLGGLTGQVGGAVDTTTRTTTDLQSRTRLKNEADLKKAQAKADLENQTDASNRTEVAADAMGEAQGQLGENAMTDTAAETALDATSQTDLSNSTQAGAALDGSTAVDGATDTMSRTTGSVQAQGDAALDTTTDTMTQTTGSVQAEGQAMSETMADTASDAMIDTRESVQGQTAVGGEASGTASGNAQTGTAIGVNTPSSVRVGVASPLSVGVQSQQGDARYNGQSRVGAEATSPSTSLDGMLTVGTTVMSQSGAMLGTISGLQTTDAGVISAVTLDGQANAVPVSALSAEGDVLVSSMSDAKIK